MAELYIRGGLANVTMKHLTPSEQLYCQEICEMVSDHDNMKKHKIQVMRMLGETIGGDYREDRTTAEQEYKIAIWKAVVNLLYHRHYTFKCSNCGATQRTIKSTGTTKPIDQMLIPCPNCQCAKLDDKIVIVDKDSDKSSLQSVIYAIINTPTSDEIEQQREILNDEELIRYSQGYRYYNPNKILSDDTQLTKFFGEFVWGYFKQSLLENSRAHKTQKNTISGRLDELIILEILEVCKKYNIKPYYCHHTQPENGWYTIQYEWYTTTLEFTASILPIIQKAHDNQIPIVFDGSYIKVKETLTAPILQSTVNNTDHISIVNSANNSSDDNQFTIESVSYNTTGDSGMEDSSTAEIDGNDVLEAIFESLPEGNCKKIFKIFTQEGEEYLQFCAKYSYDQKPKQAHIAEHLNIPIRTVKTHMEQIKLMMLAHNCVPRT